MGGLLGTVAGIFWSALMVVVLLIVGFFLLRTVGNVTKGTPVGGFISGVERAAQP